jgi:hypothetical protein
MSVNFHSNVTNPTTTEASSPCLCAQMAESFCGAMDGDLSDAVRADLRANANPTCPICHGTGVEVREESDAPTLNLASGNARLLLEALGLAHPDLWGDLPVPEARRAIMLARSRSDLTPFTRELEVTYGAPRTNEDGSVELRPLRSFGREVDVERMTSYIERFAAFVETSVSRGATIITWN